MIYKLKGVRSRVLKKKNITTKTICLPTICVELVRLHLINLNTDLYYVMASVEKSNYIYTKEYQTLKGALKHFKNFKRNDYEKGKSKE